MSNTVAVVTNIPRPYRRALFDVLRGQLAEQRMSLHALYTSDPTKHARRGSPAAVVVDAGIEHYVRGLTIQVSYDRVVSLPIGLGRALNELAPVCVVCGGFGADALLAARWCWSAGVPRVVWSGVWPGNNASAGRLSTARRKLVIKHADAYIAYGTAASDYLVSLGADPERIFYCWNTVDLERIATAAREAAGRRLDLMAKYRLAERNLLYVGTLVESKGVHDLLHAALAVESPARDWALHFVGAGPALSELETTVSEAGKRNRFRFHGLLPEKDVAELLGCVNGLILPTKREAWGLVINEAMACAVPVVASPWAGATRDLIKDGSTGYVVRPDDTGALTDIMSRLLAGDSECREVGLAGAVAVREKASLQEAAAGFVAAIRFAIASHRYEHG